MSGRRALALRSFKEEAVLARMVRSPPTLSSRSIIESGKCQYMELPDACSHGCGCALLLEFLSVLPDPLHVLCGADCQLLVSLFVLGVCR